MSDTYSNMSDDSIASYGSPSPTRYECEECDRKFVTRYNLMRHKKSFHDDEMSTSEHSSNEDESEADESDAENSSEESEDEEGDEREVSNIFRKLVEKAVNKHEDELVPIVEDIMENKNMSEKEATKQAFLDNDDVKKTFRKLFLKNVIEIDEHRHHPLFKAIMEKAKELMDDGLDREEALTAAVAYRKHAIYNLLKFV